MPYIQKRFFDSNTILRDFTSCKLSSDEENLLKLEQVIRDANRISASIAIHFGQYDSYQYPDNAQQFVQQINERIQKLTESHDQLMHDDGIDDADAEYLSSNNESRTFLTNLKNIMEGYETISGEESKKFHSVKIVYRVLEFLKLTQEEKGYSKKLITAYEEISVLIAEY